ncbi:MAG: FadR/GntR family transcriptional regulator [Frankia sp.]
MVANEHGGGRLREKPQLIADELRALIVSGALSEGDFLGREPDLVDRFGVSRPSLRDALRILEAEGLITVARGVHGGVIVHEPNQRMTARTASMVLRAREVSVADVLKARSLLEPLAAKAIASKRDRRAAVAELGHLIEQEEDAIDDPARFAVVNLAFHGRLVSLGGNQTLAIVTEMLDEVVARSLTAVSESDEVMGSLSSRRRAIRSQRRLLALLETGDAAGAEDHWQAHLAAIGRLLFRQSASMMVGLLDDEP